MPLRPLIDQVLTQADQIEAQWAETNEASDGSPTIRDWQADDDARRDLADSAVEALRAVVDAADRGEPLDLTPAAPELIFMLWEADPDEEPVTIVNAESPWAPHCTAVAEIEPGATFTVCPHCSSVDAGVLEIDRGERWNQGEVAPQPDNVGQYGSLGAGKGWGRIGSQPNPLAGLPMLKIWPDKNPDMHTERHDCAACNTEITLPAWLEVEWL